MNYVLAETKNPIDPINISNISSFSWGPSKRIVYFYSPGIWPTWYVVLERDYSGIVRKNFIIALGYATIHDDI